ncbi:MAG: histidine--tRNA ligase [Ignavibacteriales bacterium]|nr:histidine--tRNA ligase [Ignavibacteriales bacterium]
MIKAITGTKDILPNDIQSWKYLESLIEKTMRSFNYKEIRTPIFEETSLFARGIGESTDIVSKEMYTFLDKGGTSLTLRPEMTASVVRSFIEHSMAAKQNLNKLYYLSSPMFRQERPQAGRFRQFHQFGAEALGSSAPSLDAEIIIIAFIIIKELGLKNISVKINSLGVPESRENYKNILKDYLKDKLPKLSEESRKRFETNILRIFDSKEENDIEIMNFAPQLINHLDAESLEHFDEVKKLLAIANVPFEIDPKLVRGLDYYTKTTFEIISGSVGSQSALCGGGRYDLLIEQLGGKPTPGVGFAAGIERILLACENEKSFSVPEEKIDLYIVRIDDKLTQKVFDLSLYFRKENISVEVDYLQRSVKAQMREANKLNSKFVLFIGGEEYNKEKIVFKNMLNGEQEIVDINDLETIAVKIMEQNHAS